MSDPLSNPTASSEITGRAEFSELLMLLNYARRATFVFALYNTAGAREEVAEAVKRIISPTPVFTWRYGIESPFPISYLDRLTEEQRRQRAVVFFFDPERGDDKAWKSLDHNRDYFGGHPHTLVFWVTGKGRVDAANKAPHFWAQRSLVFDFTVEQPERQMELRTEWAGRGLWIENFDDAERQLSLFRGLLNEFHEMPDALPLTLADLNGKVAWLLDYLGRRDEALPFVREQLDLARKIGDQNLEAEALVNLAQVERVRIGRFAAIKLLEQAKGLATTPEKRAEVLRNLASDYTYEGKSSESLPLLDEALTLFKQVGSNLGQANVLQAIGDVQSFRAEKDAALKSYDEALRLFKQVGDNLGQANVLQAIGDVQSFRAEKDAALKSYDEALRLFKQVGDNLGQANVLKAIGDVQSFRAEKDAALKSYDEALRLFKQVGDNLGQANVLQAIGDVQSFRAEKDAALKSYDEALRLFKQVGDNLGQANMLKAIGDVQSFRDEKDAALKSYDQALALFKQVGDNLGQANVQLQKGVIFGEETYFLDALRYYDSIQHNHNIAVCKTRYGLMLRNAGEIDRGVALMNEARDIWTAMGHPSGVRWIDELLAEDDESEDAE